MGDPHALSANPSPTPYLELPLGVGERLELGIGTKTIGRSKSCSVTLSGSQISRRHCELHRDADGIRLVNLSDKNPARIDGEAVEGTALLRDGAMIRLPGYELRFRDPITAAPYCADSTIDLSDAFNPNDNIDLSDALDEAPSPPPSRLTRPASAPNPPVRIAPIVVERARAPRIPMAVTAAVLGSLVVAGLGLFALASKLMTSPAPQAKPIEVASTPEPLPSLPSLPQPPPPSFEPALPPPAEPASHPPEKNAPPSPTTRKKPAPKVTAPKVTAPKVTAPKVTPPKARPTPARSKPIKTTQKTPSTPPKVQSPPLPETRPPLVPQKIVLRGKAGELEGRTIRLYEMKRIIAALASRLAPPIAPPTSVTREARDRLIIWIVDCGPQANARLLTELGQQIVTSFGQRRAIRHALVTAGAQTDYGPVLTKATALADGLRDAANLGNGEFHDVLRTVQRCEKRYRQWRDKAIVVFTLDNADVEADVEAALKTLRAANTPLLAIVPEAISSDAFWFRQATDPSIARAAAMRLILAGAESAIVELPWGWRLMPLDPQQTVGSGFAAYAWGRLAAGSGGGVYLYHSGGTGPSFCQMVRCALCRSDHRECSTIYHEHKLGTHEPTCMRRGWYGGKLGGSAAATALRRVWSASKQAGLLRSDPPRHGFGSSQVNGKKAKKGKPEIDGLLVKGGSANLRRSDIEDLQEQAHGRRAALRSMLTVLSKCGPRASSSPFETRARANASAVYVMLMATDITLAQQLLALNGVLQSWPDGERRAIVSISIERVPLCHGTPALLDLEWPGQKPMRKALEVFCKRVDPLLRHFGGTPWELLIRRTLINRYRATVRKIPEPVAVKRPKTKRPKRPKTKRPKTPKPTRPKRPKIKRPTPKPTPKPPPTRSIRSGPSKGSGPTRTGN